MNGAQQNDNFSKFVEEMAGIMLKKGDDYAGQEDRLFNFKAVAKICGVTPAKVCQILIAVKLTRLTTIMNVMANGQMPNFESLHDTMIDLGNYSLLMDMCLKEPE